MSDEKRFEQMMGNHIDQKMKREQGLDPNALRHFSRPAIQCEFCGAPMNAHPETGQPYQMSEWERKWSIHRTCAEKAWNQMDRQAGVLSQRKR